MVSLAQTVSLEVSSPLSTEEKVRRKQLILTVEKGLSNFLAVGAALLELRSSKLYRETHSTFEGFCREVFGLGRSSCDGLIRSTQTAELLIASGAKLPDGISEATVRPVACLPSPELQTATWRLIQAVSPERGPSQPLASKVVRVIKNAIEPNGSSGNGHKARKKEHTERETPFLRPVIRLVNWSGFSPELVTSHVEKLPSARTTYEAFGKMIERCESVRSALAERFPELTRA